MSQLVARRGLRDLLVHSRVNCNMFARCVSAASVVRRAGDTNKPTLVHDWCGGFVGCNIRSEHVQGGSLQSLENIGSRNIYIDYDLCILNLEQYT